MLDLTLFRNPRFTAASASIAISFNAGRRRDRKRVRVAVREPPHSSASGRTAGGGDTDRTRVGRCSARGRGWLATRGARDARAADYVATVPELFDLWQDPQERYDILMTHWAEKTWQVGPMVGRALDLLSSYKKYPNRPLVSEALGAPRSTRTTRSSRRGCTSSFTRWPRTSRTYGRRAPRGSGSPPTVAGIKVMNSSDPQPHWRRICR